MDLLQELCEKTGYIAVVTPPGTVKVVAGTVAAPFIEGDLTDVIRRLIRLSRKVTAN